MIHVGVISFWIGAGMGRSKAQSPKIDRRAVAGRQTGNKQAGRGGSGLVHLPTAGARHTCKRSRTQTQMQTHIHACARTHTRTHTLKTQTQTDTCTVCQVPRAQLLQVHEIVVGAMLAAEPRMNTEVKMKVPHRNICFEVRRSQSHSRGRPQLMLRLAASCQCNTLAAVRTWAAPWQARANTSGPLCVRAWVDPRGRVMAIPWTLGCFS